TPIRGLVGHNVVIRVRTATENRCRKYRIVIEFPFLPNRRDLIITPQKAILTDLRANVTIRILKM
ncbi:hypothetical protein, partial [Erythrobacter sp. QSSC1-22B]|uniref:hypothetical protein n=1 Tax=Erythrobacter sp. QSSC1-22B TaxID=1860125 RepID=UPI001F1A038B